MDIIKFVQEYKEIFEQEKYDDPEQEFTNLVNVFLQYNMKNLFKKETYQQIQNIYKNVNIIYIQLYNETGLIELVYIMLENTENVSYVNWMFEKLYQHYQETKNKNELMRIIKIAQKNEKYKETLLKIFSVEILDLLEFLIKYYEHNNYQKLLVKTL